MDRLASTVSAGLAIILAFALAWLAMRPPTVVPVTAPPDVFSAARAMATVRLVSAAPHPSGSPEAARVRHLLKDRLTALGLRVTMLRGVGAGFSSGKNAAAQVGLVETIVAVLPGRDRTLSAIAMMAHTDSVQDSFGAADDGFGLAVALETIRAIRSRGQPARDVVLILTDGEEAGLLGARLFFSDSARTRHIAALVNVDSRGTSGLGTMFETGPGSGGLVARYRAVSRNRFAHSAATFLYNRLPNRTDLTATKGLDIPALNFAFLDGEFDYHTPRDALPNVDPRTLQSLGDQVMPVVRSIAIDPRPLARGPDGVFADASPVVAIRYPNWVGWPLLAVALVLAGIGSVGTKRAAVARGAAGSLAAALLAALGARASYALTGLADDWGAHHRIMALFGRYELALALVAASALLGTVVLLRRGCRGRSIIIGCTITAVVAIVLGRASLATCGISVVAMIAAWWAFSRPTEPQAVRAGTLCLGLLFSLIAQFLAPALTPLVLWPTLAAAAGIVAVRFLRWGHWLAALPSVVPLAYLLIFGHAVLLALGIPTPEAIGVFVLLAAPVVMPMVAGVSLTLVSTGIVLAAGLMLSLRITPATERHPDLSQIYGVVDENGLSWLVSPLERPDEWTQRVLKTSGRVPERATMPMMSTDPVWRVRLSGITVLPPSIVAARENGWTRITVRPTNGGRSLTLQVATDRPLRSVSANDRLITGFADQAGTFKLRWQSPGQPITLRFRTEGNARLRVTAAEITQRRIALPPRPSNVVPWLGSDRVIAIRQAAWR